MFCSRCERSLSKKVLWEVQEGCLKISEGNLEKWENDGELEILSVQVKALLRLSRQHSTVDCVNVNVTGAP